MTETGAIVRRVLVDGAVQGVGYREFTRRAALRLSVSGWVRNRYDGAVEALIRGPPAAVEALVAEMRQGPRFADRQQRERDRGRRDPWRRQRRVRYPGNGIARRLRDAAQPRRGTCRARDACPRRGPPTEVGVLAGGSLAGNDFFELLVELLFRLSRATCAAATFAALSSQRLRGDFGKGRSLSGSSGHEAA